MPTDEPPGRPAPADELVDVVDERGAVVDTVTRARMRAERLRHRCTFVLVRDSTGALLVHRRSEHKDLWPGRWDIAVGGVVGAGEEWEAAALRELAEEVGVSGVELEPLGDGTYSDDDVVEVARLWSVTWDGPVSFHDGEVVEAHWVDLEELDDRLHHDAFVPDSVHLLVPHLFGPAHPPAEDR
jgi:isopentenyldiphosphate isomerase